MLDQSVIVACATPIESRQGPTPAPTLALIRLSGRGVFDVLAHVVELEAPAEGVNRASSREPIASRGEIASRSDISSRGVHRVRVRVPAQGGLESGAHACRAQSSTFPALLLTYPGPRSFTGEDCAELVIPAGPAIVDRVLGVLLDAGASDQSASESRARVRPAGPGEFSARAYLNGRLTLEQAEGIVAMLGARTASQHAEALALLRGKRGDRYRGWADELSTLLALVEAGIDFTDQEDVVPIAPAELRARVVALADAMRGLLGHARGDAARDARLRVVLFGRPNAGKSTLFNALLGRPRAVVSDVAGTTRDVLSETLALDDAPWRADAGECVLNDLAGLEPLGDRHATSRAIACDDAGHGAFRDERGSSPRNAASTIEHQAQEHAQAALREADVVLWCDPDGLFEADRDAHEWLHWTWHERLAGTTPRIIRVRTKADLPVIAGPVTPAALGVCALDGWNLGTLRRAIADAVATPRTKTNTARTSGSTLGDVREDLCVPRHALALSRTEAALRSALERLNAAPRDDHDAGTCTAGERSIAPRTWLARPELVAGDLRAAMDALGELTGQVSPGDVIGRIFATFCVGK